MKFSIIIPCYKVERFLGECLDSVLAQDYVEWEAICVDDGSPDGTGRILDQYAARDSRIKVIHQENRGLSEARNSALRIATGEWLYYLDSDDMMPPHVLRVVDDVLKLNPDADLVRGTLTTFVDGEEVKWGDSHDGYERVDLSKTILCLSCYFQQYFYRRASFGDIPFVGPHWSEEKRFFTKVAIKANMLVTIDSPTYGFRSREGSITHSGMTLEECIGFIDAMCDNIILQSNCTKTLSPQLLRASWASLMEVCVQHIVEDIDVNVKRKAWQHWFEAIRNTANIRPKPVWFRFATAFCRMFPIRIVAWILCYLPNWLKRKGIHR